MSQNSNPSPNADQRPADAADQALHAPGSADAMASVKMMNQSRPKDLEEYIPIFHWPKDTSRFVFARATHDDSVALNDLYNRAFQQQRPLSHFEWKYWANPAGAPYGVIAKDRTTGAALAAAFGQRRRVWIRGREVPGNLMCETSSDPSARSGGVAFKGVMHAIGIGLNDEAGILWSYGGQSSDEAITVGSRWLGFRVALTLEPWECRLSLAPALQAKLGGVGAALARLTDPVLRAPWRRPPGFELEETADFGAEHDRLWERHRDRHALCFFRDSATLRWRWRDCPVRGNRSLLARRDGEPAGWVIWREGQPGAHRIGTVLDLWTDGDQETMLALLDGARRRAAAAGCAFLRFAVKPGTPEAAAVKADGAWRPSRYERPDRIIVTPMPGSLFDETPEDYDVLRVVVNGSNWYYTQGDCDFLD